MIKGHFFIGNLMKNNENEKKERKREKVGSERREFEIWVEIRNLHFKHFLFILNKYFVWTISFHFGERKFIQKEKTIGKLVKNEHKKATFCSYNQQK